MKRFVKLLAVFVATALAVVSMTVCAGAASMADIAKYISVGEEVECSFLGISSSANYFRIDCGKGDLTIYYSADQRLTAVSLYDETGKEIAYTKAEAAVGKVRNLSFEKLSVSKKTFAYWSPKLKKAEGKITYKLEKAGIYYIQIGGLGSSYSGTFTFSVDANAGTISETASIVPVITLRVGDSIGLSGMVTPKNAEKVTITYKNNGVISVSSSGKITAKAVGESYVTLKSGKQKLKITIVVSE